MCLEVVHDCVWNFHFVHFYWRFTVEIIFIICDLLRSSISYTYRRYFTTYLIYFTNPSIPRHSCWLCCLRFVGRLATAYLAMLTCSRTAVLMRTLGNYSPAFWAWSDVFSLANTDLDPLRAVTLQPASHWVSHGIVLGRFIISASNSGAARTDHIGWE